MLLTSIEMARKLEEADTLHLTRQIEALTQLFPSDKSFTAPISKDSTHSGVASLTLPSFGRKINRITGYGMAGPIQESNLVKIEELSTKHGLPSVDITICPLADTAAIELLTSRGYIVNGFLNNYVRILTDDDNPGEAQEDDIITITHLSRSQAQDFIHGLVEGYKDTGRAESLLSVLAQIALHRADTTLYIATIDGKVAGTACMALLGGVAHFYTDSTMPDFRGRGVQKALLRRRLRDAREMGVAVASVGSRPGSTSCRNIERVGFGLAYTKVWCRKDLV